MNTLLLGALFFIAFALGGRVLFGITTAGLNTYGRQTSEHMQSQLTQLFLFNDVRTLSIGYFLTLVACPVLLLLTGNGLFLTSIVFIALLVLPRGFFALLRIRRAAAINSSLPDALSQLASAMRAGSTFTVALQGFVEEDTGPLGEELSLMLREHRIGARMEDALDNLAERVKSEEMDLVVSAVLIAQDVGGNLSEILQGLSTTIRRKLEMEGKIKALTSQGMLQGYVVSALPFVMLGVLCLVEPEATLPIFESLLGWIFLAVMVTLQVVGGLMIKKIVTIEI